ncbi:MAG: MBL fold metallo-hydrolase [Lysobacterales bacterium]|jgi:glyoxylase-like metal-dependent hydrolase (beta-lactamase superfamily II)
MSDLQDSLAYEFTSRPAPGEVFEVLPGIGWLQLPLPFVLSHINTWLLDDGDEIVVVDTGFDAEEIRGVWRNVLDNLPGGAAVSRVLLCSRLGADLYMTREEYLLCRLLVADTGQPAPEGGRRFYHAAGFDERQMALYVDRFGSFGRVVSPLPESYQRLQEGQELEIGDYRWRVIVGTGHSVEHACLYCEEENVLISGDQVLPTISSNVGVWPTEPAANPLADWFTSLKRLQTLLPDDVLVLPSHGKPFRGVKHRLEALITEHEDGLDQLRVLCQEPRRAVDVFPALFKGPVNDNNLIMAVSEAVAHLNYLVYAGEMEVHADADGIKWYGLM